MVDGLLYVFGGVGDINMGEGDANAGPEPLSRGWVFDPTAGCGGEGEWLPVEHDMPWPRKSAAAVLLPRHGSGERGEILLVGGTYDLATGRQGQPGD